MRIIVEIGKQKMKNYKFKGYLKWYERLRNSYNGNPKYRLCFDNENDVIIGMTKNDSTCGYSCLNQPDKEKTVTYHYTRTGNIIITDIR